MSDCPLECTKAFGGHPDREEHNGLSCQAPTGRIWSPFVKKKKKGRKRKKGEPSVSVCVCFGDAFTPPCRTA